MPIGKRTEDVHARGSVFVRRFGITVVKKQCKLLLLHITLIILACKISIYQGRVLLHSSHLLLSQKGTFSHIDFNISIKVLLRPYRLLPQSSVLQIAPNRTCLRLHSSLLCRPLHHFECSWNTFTSNLALLRHDFVHLHHKSLSSRWAFLFHEKIPHYGCNLQLSRAPHAAFLGLPNCAARLSAENMCCGSFPRDDFQPPAVAFMTR